MDDKEFAFDVKLWGTARVTAKTEAEAREKMLNVLNDLDISHDANGVKLAGVSIEDESGEESELIEIDGEAV